MGVHIDKSWCHELSSCIQHLYSCCCKIRRTCFVFFVFRNFYDFRDLSIFYKNICFISGISGPIDHHAAFDQKFCHLYQASNSGCLDSMLLPLIHDPVHTDRIAGHMSGYDHVAAVVFL